MISQPCQISTWYRLASGARFGKVSKSVCTRKAVAESLTVWLRSCFIYIFLIWTKIPSYWQVSGVHISTSPFLDTDELQKWLYGPEKFPGLSRNMPLHVGVNSRHGVLLVTCDFGKSKPPKCFRTTGKDTNITYLFFLFFTCDTFNRCSCKVRHFLSIQGHHMTSSQEKSSSFLVILTRSVSSSITALPCSALTLSTFLLYLYPFGFLISTGRVSWCVCFTRVISKWGLHFQEVVLSGDLFGVTVTQNLNHLSTVKIKQDLIT